MLSSCSTSLPALLALSQAVVVLAHETKGMVYVVFFCQARTQGPRTTAISTSFVLFLCSHWLRSHISFPSSWLSTHSILRSWLWKVFGSRVRFRSSHESRMSWSPLGATPLTNLIPKICGMQKKIRKTCTRHKDLDRNSFLLKRKNNTTNL